MRVSATCIPFRARLKVSSCLWEAGIPLLVCTAYGMIATMRLAVLEHTGAVNKHSGNLMNTCYDYVFHIFLRMMLSDVMNVIPVNILFICGLLLNSRHLLLGIIHESETLNIRPGFLYISRANRRGLRVMHIQLKYYPKTVEKKMF